MVQGWKLQHVGTVSVLVVIKFDGKYYFVFSVSILVITLVVQWVIFYIICCFCLLGPGWLFPLTFYCYFFFLNSAMLTASHSFPIDISDTCVRLGMVWPSHAYSGRDGKYSIHILLDCMIFPFGNLKWMVGPMFVDWICGASTFK